LEDSFPDDLGAEGHEWCSLNQELALHYLWVFQWLSQSKCSFLLQQNRVIFLLMILTLNVISLAKKLP